MSDHACTLAQSGLLIHNPMYQLRPPIEPRLRNAYFLHIRLVGRLPKYRSNRPGMQSGPGAPGGAPVAIIRRHSGCKRRTTSAIRTGEIGDGACAAESHFL